MKNFIFIFLLIFWSCNESKKLTDSEDIDIFSQIRERGKIKVLTLYGSTTYFSYNGKDMGHEYELVKSFANSIDLDIEFESVTNIEELNRKIRNGEADLIAYPLDRARDIENFNYTFCGPERITKQVLIQRKEKGKTDINAISALIG